MTSPVGVWTGHALEKDQRIHAFNADPAAYIQQLGETLRSGDFDREQEKIVRQRKQQVLTEVRKFIRSLLAVVKGSS